MNPSPFAHIYRLLLVLAVMGAAFVGIRALAIPDSWDAERSYRRDALKELQQLPMRFGGNESCQDSECHEPTKRHQAKLEAVSKGRHQGVACEVCHGHLSKHARNGEKVDDAEMTAANELCQSCHQELISRPEQFAQFSETLLYHELLEVKQITPCRACHDPHEPK